MGEVLSVAEVESRYPGEWVLLGEPVKDEYDRVQSGRLLWHSPDRDQVYRKAIELAAPRHLAVLYTGKVPDDVVIIL